MSHVASSNVAGSRFIDMLLYCVACGLSNFVVAVPSFIALMPSCVHTDKETLIRDHNSVYMTLQLEAATPSVATKHTS